MTQRFNRIYFHEVQRFRQWWVWAILLVPFLFFAYGALVRLLFGEPWWIPLPNRQLFGITLMLALIMLWVYRMRLVTEVRDDALLVHFVWLWRRKKYAFRDIQRCEVRTYNPLGEYGGWGIRMGANGWVYNVSGNRGVQLEFTKGDQLLVGSQRPEELADAIRERMKDEG